MTPEAQIEAARAALESEVVAVKADRDAARRLLAHCREIATANLPLLATDQTALESVILLAAAHITLTTELAATEARWLAIVNGNRTLQMQMAAEVMAMESRRAFLAGAEAMRQHVVRLVQYHPSVGADGDGLEIANAVHAIDPLTLPGVPDTWPPEATARIDAEGEANRDALAAVVATMRGSE